MKVADLIKLENAGALFTREKLPKTIAGSIDGLTSQLPAVAASQFKGAAAQLSKSNDLYAIFNGRLVESESYLLRERRDR